MLGENALEENDLSLFLPHNDHWDWLRFSVGWFGSLT